MDKFSHSIGRFNVLLLTSAKSSLTILMEFCNQEHRSEIVKGKLLIKTLPQMNIHMDWLPQASCHRTYYRALDTPNLNNQQSRQNLSRKISLGMYGLTLMLLEANLANTKYCKNPEKSLKPWHIGTHLRVLREGYPMSTNMTGFRWFSKLFAFFCYGRKQSQHGKG